MGPETVARAIVANLPATASGRVMAADLAPLTGRRPLGVVWGLGGVIALAAAGYYTDVLVGGLPLLVILLCCINALMWEYYTESRIMALMWGGIAVAFVFWIIDDMRR